VTTNVCSETLETVVSGFNVSTESVLSQVSKSVMPISQGITSNIKYAAEGVRVAPYAPKVHFKVYDPFIPRMSLRLMAINSK
jgi:hypothetical protein